MKLFKFICGLSLFLFAIQFIASSFMDLSQGIRYFFMGAQGLLLLSYSLLFITYVRVRTSYNKKKQVTVEEKTPTIVRTRSSYRNKRDNAA
ncbi:hypothetical protein IGI37_000790 [Enterococcus sp. AZ194]|uniref:hypothetical protein n=1 Tax=Enterococcus sp. AZ194 TaxID=2774629 RepID=UPI003F207FB3